jgi:hypothetical protein
MQILSTLGKVPGKTKLSMRIIAGGETHMVRVDVINMTRHVHHHFDYRKDGHNRKYNMHVREALVVHVGWLCNFQCNFQYR